MPTFSRRKFFQLGAGLIAGLVVPGLSAAPVRASRLAPNPVTGWLCVPYKRHPTGVRYCAIDDQTRELLPGGWAEYEIDRDMAVVRVRSTSTQLAQLGRLYRSLSETDVLHLGQPILAQLLSHVPDRAPSQELSALVGRWRGVGFGQGWRLPHAAVWRGVRSGYPPPTLVAFPTTSVLDTFTGSDESPIATNWSGRFRVDGGVDMDRVSNAMKAPASNAAGSSYYDVATYGADSEVFIDGTTVHTSGSAYFGVGVRGQNPNTASQTNAYTGWFWGGGTHSIQHMRFLNGDSGTQIGSWDNVANFSDGDSYGYEVIGTTIQAYRKTGGSWSTYGSSRTDANITGTGYLVTMGQQPDPPAGVYDNFGGGTVVGGASPNTLMLMGVGT